MVNDRIRRGQANSNQKKKKFQVFKKKKAISFVQVCKLLVVKKFGFISSHLRNEWF